MFGPSSVMISAPETSRLRIDSEITASGMDLYHSSGVNCEVTIVETLPSRPARILRSWCAVAASTGVVRTSSKTRTSTSWRCWMNFSREGSAGCRTLHCQFGGEHAGAVEPCGVVVATCCLPAVARFHRSFGGALVKSNSSETNDGSFSERQAF